MVEVIAVTRNGQLPTFREQIHLPIIDGARSKRLLLYCTAMKERPETQKCEQHFLLFLFFSFQCLFFLFVLLLVFLIQAAVHSLRGYWHLGYVDTAHVNACLR